MMKIDKYIGQIQFQAISVSPESSPEEIRTSCRNFILKIEGPASGEKIVLQDENYWIRLNFKGNKLVRIDFTQLQDGKPSDDLDDIMEMWWALKYFHGNSPGAPFWKLQFFCRDDSREPPVGGLSFQITPFGWLRRGILFRRSLCRRT